ncbi:hypothetical protein QYE76_053478 [Lolium multiflorum]|uniref:Uncharacterized protein n=1 Tax=Lolium multiflorum TaxID=4521 RepID=A0AAD8WK46_LOLMU|nr:hypothetical protein QYE76_053478 [Lolium multiflorum]
MENYSLLMGAAVMKMAVEMAAVSMEKPSGHFPPGRQQDGPEPVPEDGSSLTLHPPAPVVLFCKNSPSLKKVVMQSQPISPKSASQSGASPKPAAPRASARTAVRKVAARKTLRRHTSASAQQIPHTSTEEISSEDTQSGREESSSGTSGKNTVPSEPDLPPSPSKKRSASQTDDTSSGEVKEVMMPSTTLDLTASNSGAEKAASLVTPLAEAREPIASSPAAPMVSGEVYDLSNLLTFDPESIEPTAKASEAPGPNATQGQFQQLKALLSSSIETLVEDTEEIKNILEDLQPHLPVTLQTNADGLIRKKAALDAKTDTSPSSAELEILRKELKDLEERVRVTNQLIQDKEALIARSNDEAEDLKAELKTDLAEIRVP